MCSLEENSDLEPPSVQTKLVFFVNGKKIVEPAPDPAWTLLFYLRTKLRLTGTKLGCAEGGCGACTVMLSRYQRLEDKVIHIAVNACLTPICTVHGVAVTTVEGIGSTHSELNPVQERIAKSHGSQCGFCTPGIVMSMYTLLRNDINIKYNDIETALQGNLCRCTGYRPIIEGFKTFVEVWEKAYTNGFYGSKRCKMGEQCCQNKKYSNLEDNLSSIKSTCCSTVYTDKQPQTLVNTSSFKPYDRTQEPIFPPELKLGTNLDDQHLKFSGESSTWFRPTSLESLLDIKQKYPNSKIVVGNTEIGIEIKFKNMSFPTLISPTSIKEMNFWTRTDSSLIIGAAVTLADLQAILKDEIRKCLPYKVRVLQTIVDMLHWFAGTQIRNVASLAGNIMTASPISDLNPILMACGAIAQVCSKTKGKRRIVIDETFFCGYRKTILDNSEILLSIEIPFTAESQYFKAYKQAKRREDDISIVTAAFNIELEQNSKVVKSSLFCFGGMGPTTICAKNTAMAINGLCWNDDLLKMFFKELNNELKLDASAPGGMVEYRRSLCLSQFFKFYLEVLNEVSRNGFKVSDSSLSAVNCLTNVTPKSSQYFDISKHNRKATDVVGMPIVHVSALKQATGEAIYCDDIPYVQGELFLSLVFSAKSHAKIVSIDAKEALSLEGVVLFLCAKDIPTSKNKIGPIFQDEEIFSSEFVTSQACVLGAIVAISESVAKKATHLVKVFYEDMPAIITLEEAISNKSFYPGYPRTIRKGDINIAFKNADRVTNGSSRNGAQEHFYLETHVAIATKKEDEMEIFSSSQNPSGIARTVAEVLGIPNNKVVVRVKRIGGGFGGKESRAAILALPVAIAAYKLNRTVRGVFDRDEDMRCTGFRHPHLINYKVAFNNDSKIVGAVFDVYSNAGSSMDLSSAVNERSTTHIDNCYFIPNVEVNGYVCKTNIPSNTAFRGFGAPQAMFAAESMMRDIANVLGKTYEEVAVANLYREGDLTHFNQLLTHCTIRRCWDECIEMSGYVHRKKNIEEYNRMNRWKKKGISMVPTKFGVSFQVDMLMQAGALVLIYTDGSVLLSIGGMEMGQGLFTKMIQIASRVLEIDLSKINISETATDKVPNSSATAASVSSDLYGMAVVDACQTILNRLLPYKSKNPIGKWEDWVLSAFLDRVSLSATGFYSSPKIEYDFETNSGNLFEYFTYGVGCSEVIVDCLTGDHQVLRTDIVMDLGDSLNPAIDIGQIEGAFMQGYGFYTMEEIVFSPKGDLYTKGPGTYKIPGFSDIPQEFNVSLLKGAPNPRAIYASKAVGEPPLALASSVFFAIKEAVSSARADAGVNPHFYMPAPATCARIRMACEDEITKQVDPPEGNGKPWNVMA